MTILLPKIMYGRYRDVRPRLMRIARRMRKGDEWISLVEQDGFLNVAETTGYIVGDGPSSLLGADEHFQMWLLWMLARQGGMRTIRDIEERIFEQSLSRAWSVLGLVMSRNDIWFMDRSRHRPFLAAVYPHWNEFIAIGARFTLGRRFGQELWNMHNTVLFVLGHQGIPREQMRDRMTSHKLAEFLQALGIGLTTVEARV